MWRRWQPFQQRLCRPRGLAGVRTDQAELAVDRRRQRHHAQAALVVGQGRFGHQRHAHAFAHQHAGTGPVAHRHAHVRQAQAGVFHQAFTVRGDDERLVGQFFQGDAALPEATKAYFRDKLVTRFDFLQDTLGRQDYLAGAAFSVVDAYLFTVLGWCKFFSIDLARWPALAAYVQRIGARPAVQAALRAEAGP